MGMLLILLGLAAAGLVADFVVENDLTTAPGQAVSILGGSFRLSLPELVLGAAVLGALAVGVFGPSLSASSTTGPGGSVASVR